MFIQKLLLLPELSGTAITGTDSDSVNVSHSCNIPTVEVVNKGFFSKSEHESQTNARITVSSLTASWSDVRNYNSLIFNCYELLDLLGRRETSFRRHQFHCRPGKMLNFFTQSVYNMT